MSDHWKPADYPSVSVYLMTDNAAQVVAFLKATFGATEHRRMDTPDGRIAHLELRIDDSVVMLSEATDAYPAIPTWLHVYVPDVDATYARALAAGGRSVQEPVQKGDPDKRGGVMDPGGNTWWISTQVG
ncbi:MAG TPA: VOC family protein [Gemmatimonadales bacterium]|nr:VOC family protein [Gemmatimonadales bacterium]